MPPKKAASRKKKREDSVDSAAASDRSASSKGSKHSDEADRKAKDEKKASASKKRGGRRTKFVQMDEDEELALMAEAKSVVSPQPEAKGSAEASVTEVAAASAPEEDEVVPLAAVQAVDVDRTTEADHGLLKEPGPPPLGSRRVTVEGENAPALPMELLQLLAG